MQVTSNKPHSKQLNEVRIVTALVVNLVETYSSRGAYKGAISAWRVSSDMANKISTVIGVYKSQVVVVIEGLSLIHISEPTRRYHTSRMPSSA